MEDNSHISYSLTKKKYGPHFHFVNRRLRICIFSSFTNLVLILVHHSNGSYMSFETLHRGILKMLQNQAKLAWWSTELFNGKSAYYVWDAIFGLTVTADVQFLRAGAVQYALLLHCWCSVWAVTSQQSLGQPRLSPNRGLEAAIASSFTDFAERRFILQKPTSGTLRFKIDRDIKESSTEWTSKDPHVQHLIGSRNLGEVYHIPLTIILYTCQLKTSKDVDSTMSLGWLW